MGVTLPTIDITGSSVVSKISLTKMGTALNYTISAPTDVSVTISGGLMGFPTWLLVDPITGYSGTSVTISANINTGSSRSTSLILSREYPTTNYSISPCTDGSLITVTQSASSSTGDTGTTGTTYYAGVDLYIKNNMTSATDFSAGLSLSSTIMMVNATVAYNSEVKIASYDLISSTTSLNDAKSTLQTRTIYIKGNCGDSSCNISVLGQSTSNGVTVSTIIGSGGSGWTTTGNNTYCKVVMTFSD